MPKACTLSPYSLWNGNGKFFPCALFYIILSSSCKRPIQTTGDSVSLKVDLHFFTSSTVEEQVSYGGEVVGESAMKRVEDIGNEVIHKYYVWAS